MGHPAWNILIFMCIKEVSEIRKHSSVALRERVAPFHLSPGTQIHNYSILFLLYLDTSAYLEGISLEVLYLAEKEFLSDTHREILHSAH